MYRSINNSNDFELNQCLKKIDVCTQELEQITKNVNLLNDLREKLKIYIYKFSKIDDNISQCRKLLKHALDFDDNCFDEKIYANQEKLQQLMKKCVIINFNELDNKISSYELQKQEKSELLVKLTQEKHDLLVLEGKKIDVEI